jgi:hypothetical protein
MKVVPISGCVEMTWSRETGAPSGRCGSEASGLHVMPKIQ